MTTRTHFAPPFAPRFWSDNRDIFVELPSHQGSEPFVHCFPLSEGGLARALKLIPTIVGQPGYLSGGSNFPRKPRRDPFKISQKTISDRYLRSVPDEVKNKARELVRKLKVGS